VRVQGGSRYGSDTGNGWSYGVGDGLSNGDGGGHGYVNSYGASCGDGYGFGYSRGGGYEYSGLSPLYVVSALSLMWAIFNAELAVRYA
jgi:hypothetical protein